MNRAGLSGSPDGYSLTVVAPDQTAAIVRAVDKLAETKGVIGYEVPLYIEDLGDGAWEVVLRPRITTAPVPRESITPDSRADIIRLEDFLGSAGLRGRA
jgi:hypothetical protein